jgi:hypothetical protein
MPAPSVSTAAWRRLYDAALRFRDLTPWHVLNEAEIFGVRDPSSNEIGYCSVLGEAEQVYALCVYRGSRGLELLESMLRREMDPEDTALADNLDCLMVDFVEASLLHKEDRNVIKSLNIKFRPRGLRPQFRSYLPGSVPWFLTEEEAGLLVPALEAGSHIASAVAQDNPLPRGARAGKYPVYVAEGDETPRVSWSISWVRPEPVPPPAVPIPALQGDAIADLLGNKAVESVSAWEADSFIVPHCAVHDRPRPYRARFLIVAHHESMIILDSRAIPGDSAPQPELHNLLLSTMRKFRCIPVEVMVRDRLLLEVLKPLSSKLGFQVKVRKELPAITRARSSLSDMARR